MMPEDIDELRRWMARVSTPTLETILRLNGENPVWYRDEMIAEVLRRQVHRAPEGG